MASTPTVELNWLRPFTFKEVIQSEQFSGSAGIYLHIRTRRNGKTVLAYLGKAMATSRDLRYRQIEHYLTRISGQRLPADLSPNGMYWEVNPNDDALMSFFFDETEYCKYVAAGFTYTNSCRVFIAELDKRHIAEVEKNLIYDLRPQENSPRKSQPSSSVHIVHRNATWANDDVRSQFRHGFAFVEE